MRSEIRKSMTQFSIIEELKIAYRDLDVITTPSEFREQEKYIAELEKLKN